MTNAQVQDESANVRYDDEWGMGQITNKAWSVSKSFGRRSGMYAACCENWTKGVFFALAIIAAPLVMGLLQDEDGSETDFNDQLNFTFVIPGIVYYLITTIMTGQMRNVLAMDMMQESSKTVSFKESVRTNLTNSAVVAALFLTMALAMVQADPPFADGSYRFCSQWYILFSFMATLASAQAVVMCSLCLMYVEPLDEKASIVFYECMMTYFGEPLANIGVTVFNILAACIVWIFGAYGARAGILCSGIVFFNIM